MLTRIDREPVLITALVQAIVALIVAFGVPLTQVQAATIMGVTAAILAIVCRGQVTPAHEVAAQQLPTGEVIAGPAAPIPDGEPVAVVQDAYVGEHRGTEEEPPIPGTTL